jgi:hypothetical protein
MVVNTKDGEFWIQILTLANLMGGLKLKTPKFYSGGRAPSSGFSDWPAQQKTMTLLMKIITRNLN